MVDDAGVIQPLIIVVRGHRVMMDADLARLYGVPTGRFNEAFTRNRRRFPDEFAFRLTAQEFSEWKAKGTLGAQRTDPAREKDNLPQIAIGSQKHRDPKRLPWAFTEHGALMAANILRSDRAVQMSVFVIRAFMKLREEAAANAAILKRGIGFHAE